jgi:hypothetical protein
MVIIPKLSAGIKIQMFVSTIFMTYFIIGMVMKVSGTQINIVLQMELKQYAEHQSQKFITLSNTKLNTDVFRLAANGSRLCEGQGLEAQNFKFSTKDD